MRITLVNMPWHVLDWPSMALATLDGTLSNLGHQVSHLYENIRFPEYLLTASGGRITPDDYITVSLSGYEDGVGEWIFSSALSSPGRHEDAYVRWLRDREYGPVAQATGMHRLVPEYIRQAADRVLAGKPDLVGLTSTFEQNVPSLALATELKRRQPALPVVMGGANCDGVMGAALHRNFTCLDYVVRGEGEQPVTELMEALEGRRDLADVSSLCWRDRDGRSVENPYRPSLTPGDQIPVPHLRPYFADMETSPVRNWVGRLHQRLESSRGCWWGEKRQCTFCGLNGGAMKYRSKPPERVWAEIEQAVHEHQVLDIAFTDNILDPAYLDSLLPRVSAAGWDLRIFYEVKSNLRPEQMRALSAPGVTVVQPGIENLSSGPLELMDKGTTGAAQVRALRLFLQHGIFPGWNYLYGFPGEQWHQDYADVVRQMPALVHLPPPSHAIRFSLERFSPLFDRPELGIDDPRRALGWYRLVYDLPDDELVDLAYIFEYQPRGISEAQARELHSAVDQWKAGYEHSSLSLRACGDSLTIRDRRAGWASADHVLRNDEAIVYSTLERHLSLPGLKAALRAGGCDIPEKELSVLLGDWLEAGLVYRDVFRRQENWVALAVPADPRRRNGASDIGPPTADEESLNAFATG
ncbi:RiPP maturation radical SAM C-methyltransferase [Kineosporia sp. J2-2]|uniref:RiPP maturation radical SAM C-methyltransferase n=1 Tax=Kineosporia corallincola TaxID=2835133 RepID=A0ABS5THI9_9ACTN|nr:RiPP maturation radical SAM C-methyltransferase [Kineosporia corallincola]MBT0769859.1 RiPP maturation radical SAM C-methyltransferase [Kineosporia corallincola]